MAAGTVVAWATDNKGVATFLILMLALFLVFGERLTASLMG